MPATAPVRRRARLGASDWLLLGEGLVALAVASVAIRLLPFRKVAAAASRRKGGAIPDEARLRKLRWPVNAWGKRVPWRAVCFQRGLALHWMLQRRGIASRLHYGVAPTGEEGISAHVWISVGGRDWLGGEEAARFQCLAIFPPESGEA